LNTANPRGIITPMKASRMAISSRWPRTQPDRRGVGLYHSRPPLLPDATGASDVRTRLHWPSTPRPPPRRATGSRTVPRRVVRFPDEHQGRHDQVGVDALLHHRFPEAVHGYDHEVSRFIEELKDPRPDLEGARNLARSQIQVGDTDRGATRDQQGPNRRRSDRTTRNLARQVFRCRCWGHGPRS
jgi:hypothetical protein